MVRTAFAPPQNRGAKYSGWAATVPFILLTCSNSSIGLLQQTVRSPVRSPMRSILPALVGHMFGLGPVNDWDAAIVTRYPSAEALAEMWLSREFIAAHKNRADGVER